MFVLITSLIDENVYPARFILEQYKGQYDVERIFRFIKNPAWVGSFCLKKIYETPHDKDIQIFEAKAHNLIDDAGDWLTSIQVKNQGLDTVNLNINVKITEQIDPGDDVLVKEVDYELDGLIYKETSDIIYFDWIAYYGFFYLDIELTIDGYSDEYIHNNKQTIENIRICEIIFSDGAEDDDGPEGGGSWWDFIDDNDPDPKDNTEWQVVDVAHFSHNSYATNAKTFDYDNNVDITMELKNSISLSGYDDVWLGFYAWFKLEGNHYDEVSIEYSNGGDWAMIDPNDVVPQGTEGFSENYEEHEYGWLWFEYKITDAIYLSENFRFRFRFTTDNGINYLGVRIDDIILFGYQENPSYGPVARFTATGLVNGVNDVAYSSTFIESPPLIYEQIRDNDIFNLLPNNYDYIPYTVRKNTQITLDATESFDRDTYLPGNDNLQFSWDFGYGVSSTGDPTQPNTWVKYDKVGIHTIQLTVTDNDDVIPDSDTLHIAICDSAPGASDSAPGHAMNDYIWAWDGDDIVQMSNPLTVETYTDVDGWMLQPTSNTLYIDSPDLTNEEILRVNIYYYIESSSGSMTLNYKKDSEDKSASHNYIAGEWSCFNARLDSPTRQSSQGTQSGNELFNIEMSDYSSLYIDRIEIHADPDDDTLLGYEEHLWETDKYDPDCDTDDLNDGSEVHGWGPGDKYNTNPLNADTDSDNVDDKVEYTTYKTNPMVKPKWTFIVYMGGDNDLDSYVIEDRDEMKSVGSSDDVNIIMLYDRSGTGDSKCYFVTQGKGLHNIALSDIDETWSDELDMSDPDNLVTFCNWVHDHYRGSNYVVDLWNHGSGWDGVITDDTTDPDAIIEIYDLDGAINSIRSDMGKIDILAFDACLMANYEVTYELFDDCNYIVSSEEEIPLNGYPYDDILTGLTNNPGWSSATLSKKIVDYFVASYEPSGSQTENEFATLSAINCDSSKHTYLWGALNDACELMIDDMTTLKNDISTARHDADYYGQITGQVYPFVPDQIDSIDLYDFCDILANNLDPNTWATLITKLENVKTKISNAIIKERHYVSGSTEPHANSHGVSIFFPDDPGEWSAVRDEYRKLNIKDSKWDEFLDAWYA